MVFFPGIGREVEGRPPMDGGRLAGMEPGSI